MVLRHCGNPRFCGVCVDRGCVAYALVKSAADLQRTLTDPAEHSIVTMHAIVRPQAALKTPGLPRSCSLRL